MKFLISYFYQVRFFKNYMIPFSTAVWDPKWFHKGLNCFVDKNGVYNGLRLNCLAPMNSDCHGREGCQQLGLDECSFLKKYREQLSELDFNDMIQYCEEVAMNVKENQGFSEEPIIVLLVYETPDNPCSERAAIKELFEKNGYTLEEFRKEDYD